MPALQVLDDDRHIWEHELADFVPERIFDAHTHLYDLRYMAEAEFKRSPLVQEWPHFGLAELRHTSDIAFPGRELHALTMGWPAKGVDLVEMDILVAESVATDPKSLGLMLAHPGLTASQVEERLDKTGLAGFKPYMCFSTNPDPAQSTVLEMLPEHYWQIANERRLIVLLHLGRHTALADPVNQQQIRDLAERFPRVRMQLAHCGRCFTPQIAEAGLPTVADLPNVHVDTSAVCETEVFHILLDVWPRERILFGTDNSIAGLARGKYVAFGRGWYGIQEDNTAAFSAPHVPYRPTFVAYENLRAVRYAARRKGWGKREIDDFFWNNAQRILFHPPTGS